MSKAAEWTETTTADNAAATATHAAETGKAHFVTSIHASFSATVAKLLTLKDGTTVIGNFYIYDSGGVTFDSPVRITDATLVELSLAASGTGGNVGAVTMSGYSVGAGL